MNYDHFRHKIKQYDGLYVICSRNRQPIRTRYLSHVTDYQPIRDQFFLILTAIPSLPLQDQYMGGFAKWEGYLPDVLHSYFGIAGMFVISGEVPLHPALNISMRAYNHWLNNAVV